jgi:hypothetical protein
MCLQGWEAFEKALEGFREPWQRSVTEGWMRWLMGILESVLHGSPGI